MSAQEIIQLRETVASLESQLVSLYDQMQGRSIGEMHETILSFEDQLAAMYAEKLAMGDAQVSMETVNSLEAQVIALTDEKMLLESKEKRHQIETTMLKNRARAVGAALFEAAIFSSQGKVS